MKVKITTITCIILTLVLSYLSIIYLDLSQISYLSGNILFVLEIAADVLSLYFLLKHGIFPGRRIFDYLVAIVLFLFFLTNGWLFFYFLSTGNFGF